MSYQKLDLEIGVFGRETDICPKRKIFGQHKTEIPCIHNEYNTPHTL